jgi:NAD(P)-dependent dehydrogenase (short-subunit alcohol dehydrogenase family)
LVDVVGGHGEIAHQLAAECSADQDHSEVAWSGEVRRALTITPLALPSANPRPQIGATWLITGGLGRLGLAVAERLAAEGAKRIVLVGRSPPSQAVVKRIGAIRSRGTSIEFRRIDVTDAAAVNDIVGELATAEPLLEGVVHAAGVIEDGVFQQLDPVRAAKTISPKVLGALHLHVATAPFPLRHFVLFSSLAGLFGNPGQGVYAAANAFLDGIAAVRHGAGLAGLSLNWGAWASAAADPALAQRLEAAGMLPIPEADGLDAFVRALAVPVPQLALVPMRPGRSLGVEQVHLPVPAVAPSALRVRLASLPPDARVRHLSEHVLQTAATILGCGLDALDGDRGFFEQGLASLNIMELRNRLQQALGTSFPTTLAFDYPTASVLSAELMRRLDDLPAPALPAPAIVPGPASDNAIAIIGTACRMPGGVTNADEFWALLRDGIDAITPVPPDRWDADAFYHPDPDHRGTIVTRHGGFVDGIEGFDPGFFGIAPREARQIDPQQRILLEVCLELLEPACRRARCWAARRECSSVSAPTTTCTDWRAIPPASTAILAPATRSAWLPTGYPMALG